jgi:hypothetical protein
MQILVRPAPGFPPHAVALVNRRLEFALGRFGSRVRSLHVRLQDVNGQRGGVDKQCLISVRLERPRRLIVVEDVAADLESAVSGAVERVSRTVARAIQLADDWRGASSAERRRR